MPITKKKTSSGFNNIINCKDKYCSKSKNGKKCMKKNCAKEVTTLDKNVKNAFPIECQKNSILCGLPPIKRDP